MKLKQPMGMDVLTAARRRISYVFDNFERVYVSYSGGKDSTVLLHLTVEEARRRGRRVGAMLIDFEAQYQHTIEHIERVFDAYADCLDVHWVCLPIKLRNAASSFEPTWLCWDPERKDDWVRSFPKHSGVISDPDFYPFFYPGMEFEEFVDLFGEWYSEGVMTADAVGIRADESLNRFRTIALFDKRTHGGHRWTTGMSKSVYKVYPIYDWRTSDIWTFHAKYPAVSRNGIYDLMHKAGVPSAHQRLCQPYGDDQRRGLWLYHILEPQTWYRVVARVNGANSAAVHVQERGNVSGYNKISLPEGHTYKSFCNLLLATLPKVSRDHYVERFRSFLRGWVGRGYAEGIPDWAPRVLENAYWAPSWRRLCKVLLRNDWWCKGLGMQQPKSEAYGRYLEIKRARKK